MDEKTFTKNDVSIAEQLAEIRTRIEYLVKGQDSMINYIKNNDDEHENITTCLGKINNKIHWIIGVGVGIVGFGTVATFIVRVYGS